MNKFRNKSRSEDRATSRTRENKKAGGDAAGDEKKNYKAKRSFTRNKSFRAAKEAGLGNRGHKTKKPFKDSYEKGYQRADKPAGKKPPYRVGKEDRPEEFKKGNQNDLGKEKFRVGKQEKSGIPSAGKNKSDSANKRVRYNDFEEGKAFVSQSSRGKKEAKRFKPSASQPKPSGGDGLIRLNKYLSNAGIASRRDADDLIISGAVKVNGIVVDKLGAKISPTDKVTYGDSSVKTERKVYLLLNKPKDYITTVEDPRERKTVMELVKGACRERIYPVGRLDRNTTGLLLFTNDGDMTKKLTHPKFGVKKIYHVSLNKGLKPDDFSAIVEGVELEDGIVKVDDLAFVGEGKKEVGIEIHSGRNRIVRRLFEHLGYDVLKLDRVVFAGLTKKDLPRGKHRFLTGKEISFLQMIG